MSYWLIAVPNEGGVPQQGRANDDKSTFSRLNESTQRRSLSSNHEIVLPQLKVGTLDSLMSLSEELAKSDQLCEQIAKKIERAYKEIHKQDKATTDDKKAAASAAATSASAAASQLPDLEILYQGHRYTAREYAEKFRWDEMRYNKRTPLKQLADGIVKEALKADDNLRKMQSDYSEVRSQYAAIERLETGSLLVRPLSKYVAKEDLITGEYLETLLVVVARARKEEFESTYVSLEEMAEKAEAQRRKEREAADKEREHDKLGGPSPSPSPSPQPAKPIATSSSSSSSSASSTAKKDDESKAKKMTCRSVIPGSAKLLCNEGSEEFLLYRVVILRAGAELYKGLLREKRYTVRTYKHDPEEELRRTEAKKQLSDQKKNLYAHLVRWCTTEYSESFSRWVHLKFIRLFVEAVLRYGLPVNFRAFLLEPVRGKEKQLRSTLRELYSKLAGDNANLTAALDSGEVDPSGLGEDFYSYVYLPLNTIEASS